MRVEPLKIPLSEEEPLPLVTANVHQQKFALGIPQAEEYNDEEPLVVVNQGARVYLFGRGRGGGGITHYNKMNYNYAM